MDEDAGAKNELDVSSVLSVNFVGQRFALPEVIQQLLPLILPLRVLLSNTKSFEKKVFS